MSTDLLDTSHIGSEKKGSLDKHDTFKVLCIEILKNKYKNSFNLVSDSPQQVNGESYTMRSTFSRNTPVMPVTNQFLLNSIFAPRIHPEVGPWTCLSFAIVQSYLFVVRVLHVQGPRMHFKEL